MSPTRMMLLFHSQAVLLFSLLPREETTSGAIIVGAFGVACIIIGAKAGLEEPTND